MIKNKGLVILVEDLKETQDIFESIFQAGGLFAELDLVFFSTVDEFDQFSQTPEFKRAKIIIFDLANTSREEVEGGINIDFKVEKYIHENYHTNRLPIIIHSGFIERFNGFDEVGTVFKKQKTGNSIEEIISLIQLMQKSGFLDVFSPGGFLEITHATDLHSVFTSQFRNNELPELLQILLDCHQENCANRATQVFQRLALRALINKLTAARATPDGDPNNPQINIIEHFYRRTNLDSISLWTGDLFESKTNNTTKLYILTPRCDLANKSARELENMNILVCPVMDSNFTWVKKSSGATEKEKKDIHDAVVHTLSKYGVKTRIIPPSPFYPSGGKIDLSVPFTINYRVLVDQHKYIVSLSDDLVNEVALRFGAYLARPGITEVNIDELGWLLKPHE